MKALLKQTFCKHLWTERLILSVGRVSHYEVATCDKCGKSKTGWSGTREQWYAKFHPEHYEAVYK